MNLLLRIVKRYLTRKDNSEYRILPIERNDKCYCDSGLKFKKCHSPKLEKENKIAFRKINTKTGQEEIEIIKKENFKNSSNLRWADIGVGSSDKPA